MVRDAWSRQQRISIHGWIYAIDNGYLQDLGISITRTEQASQQYEAAIRRLTAQTALS
jgi:carbonic anhydrase